MGKVIEDVAVGAALVGASLLVPGGFLAASALLTGPSSLATMLATAGAGFVLSGVGTLLGQKAQGIASTSRNPISPWQVIYGTKMVGGTVVYQEEVADNDRILLLVIAVACHSCDAITQVWFNNKPLNFQLNTEFADESNPNGFWESYDPPQGTWPIETISRTNDVVNVSFTQNPTSLFTAFDGQTLRIENTRDSASGNSFDGYFPVVETGPNSFSYTCGGPQGAGTGNPGHVVSTWPQYGDTVTVGYYLGNQTQASGIIIGNTAGYWTSECILQGRTYVAAKLTYDSKYYNGIPEIKFVVNGKNDIFDPRGLTNGFTHNAALIIADYLANPIFGFAAQYGTQIPTAELIAAANLCDTPVALASGLTEPSYTCDGSFDVSVKRGVVLENLLTSCAGRLVYIGGQFTIQPAGWVTPIGSVTVGGCSSAPKMMMSSFGLVPEAFNSPASYVPGCAGTTQSQLVFILGLLNAYQATGNSNALALAQRGLNALVPYLFRGTPPPASVTATNIWSPDSYFGVKQAFTGDDGELISINQDFASDLAGGWRTLQGREIQTSCDAYNWAMRVFAAAAQIIDGITPPSQVNLGYGNNPYGTYPYGDPPAAAVPVTSGYQVMHNAIRQMAKIAYSFDWPAVIVGSSETIISVEYQGGMIPFLADFLGNPAPALAGWQGPVYTGYQSPWAVSQVNPNGVSNAVAYLAEAQATLQASGTVADNVTFTVTGPNAQTATVAIQINSAGYASCQWQYVGSKPGTDAIVATLPSHGLSSNQAQIKWNAYSTFACFDTQIAVYPADGTGVFNTLGTLLSTQQCQGLEFNAHPYGIFPGDPHQSGNQANPFVCNQTGPNGEYEGDLAILNTSGPFNAVITGSFTIGAAGNVAFTALVNSRFVIGVQGATYVSGPQNFGALAGGTAVNHYAVQAGNNSGAWPGGNWAQVTFTLNFPAAGVYPFEIDYASGLYAERQFVLQSNAGVIPFLPLPSSAATTATGTAPSGQLQLTPYSGGFSLGEQVVFTLQLSGLAYTGPSSGPFAPVFQQATPPGVEQWLPLNTFGFAGPDPNYTAGYYQYRPLAELCDAIAAAAGTESWYTQATTVSTNFIGWLAGKWTTAASGPPNYFPQTGATTTAVDMHCAALILYSVLSLDLAARPTGAGGTSAMNANGYALLQKVYMLCGDTYLTSGPMAGTFCLDPTGAQDWSPIWSGEILRALSKLVTWATVNAQASIKAQAIVWIDGLINFGLLNVVVVDPDLGYTVKDLRGSVLWKPNLPKTELFNGIKGTYISPSNQWQQADFPSYAQDAIHGYTNGTEAHDYDANWDADGQRLWKDVQLPFTTSCSMAQRIAKIELMRIRWQGRGTIQGLLSTYPAAPLDVVFFSFAPFGWINKVLEIANTRLVFIRDQDKNGKEVTLIGTELDLAETDASVYEWSTTEELSVQGYSYIPGLSNLAPE